MSKMIFLCTAILVSMASNAAAKVTVLDDTESYLRLEVKEMYVLGDNDTLIDARNISIEQSKKSASDFAGNYVEQSLVVNGRSISEQHIRVLTAGYLEVLKTSEEKTLNDEGHLILITTSTVRLSKESIEKGIAQLRNGTRSTDELQRLESENQQLRSELAQVAALLENSSGHDTDTRPALAERRDTLVKKLEQRRSMVRHYFEQGVLLDKARSDDLTFETARFRFKYEILEHFKQNTEISLSEPEFIDNGDGTYDMRVFVGWHTPIPNTLSFWKTYFNFIEPAPENEFTLLMTSGENSNNAQRRPFTQSLYEDIRKDSLSIRVVAGNHSVELPISALVDVFGYPRPESGHIYKLQYQANKDTRSFVHYGIENPVTIKAIPSAELSQLTSLSADVVIAPTLD